MENLFDRKSEKDKREIKAEKQQEVTHKLIGKILPRRGQRIFAKNNKTGEIKEVIPEFETDTINLIDFIQGKLPPRKIDIEDG